MTERSVPTADEVRAWELRYNARYRAEHRARNQAMLQMFEDDPTPMRVDHVAAHVEGELEAALGLVQMDHEAIAKARGAGFARARDLNDNESCPYLDNFDEFMAWHAGYMQATAQPDFKGARGYTPPQPDLRP